MRTLEDVLAEIPFFSGMSSEELGLLAGCARNVHFDAGDVLFREGDPANEFYVVRQGTVAIEVFAPAAGSITVETIEAGDVVGWSWLFPPYRSHFDARALGPVRATVFDGACLRGKCDEDPALGLDFMRRFTQVLIARLQWTRLRLVDIYGHGRR